MIDCEELGETADRYKVSDSATAILCNMWTKTLAKWLVQRFPDSGLTESDVYNEETLLDRKKIERSRERAGDNSSIDLVEHLSGKLQIVGFDGKIDRTVEILEKEIAVELPDGSRQGVDQGKKQTVVKQDHCCFLGFTDETTKKGRYIDHSSPKSGKAIDVAQDTIHVINKYDSKDSFKGVLMDGCGTNTGTNGGVARILEIWKGDSIHWFVCLLHLLEIIMKALFVSKDGTTDGPNAYKGPIGKAIAGDLTTLPVVNFQPIPGKVVRPPQEVIDDMSSDQKYAIDMACLIQEGIHLLDDERFRTLPTKQTGPLDHARWLMLGNRIMRLYISTKNPSDTLKRMVYIVINFYLPCWLFAKINPKMEEGSVVFHHIVKQSEACLDKEEKKVVQKKLDNNSYWAHSEQVLLAMLKDSDATVRARAVTLIQEARKRAEKGQSNTVRAFKKPKIDLKTSSYTDFVLRLRDREIFEPPLTKHYTEAQLKRQVEDVNNLKFVDCPSNSQCVERWIRRVSSASQYKIGYYKRHQALCSTQASVDKIPKWKSKKDLEDSLPGSLPLALTVNLPPGLKRPSRGLDDAGPCKHKKEI